MNFGTLELGIVNLVDWNLDFDLSIWPIDIDPFELNLCYEPLIWTLIMNPAICKPLTLTFAMHLGLWYFDLT